jgi:hypothetical protein
MARKQSGILVGIEKLKETMGRSRRLIEDIKQVARDLEVQTAQSRKLTGKVSGENFPPEVKQAERTSRIDAA